jgi:hypothetical protein
MNPVLREVFYITGLELIALLSYNLLEGVEKNHKGRECAEFGQLPSQVYHIYIYIYILWN